jgi:polyisoprenoid-binding protein YceI
MSDKAETATAEALDLTGGAPAALANTRIINGVVAPAPGDWELDVAHTNLMFVARYMMLTKVRGRFNKFQGTIHVAERPKDSWAELTIDAASIDTDNETRDNHLRSSDFLDLENNPNITFRSTKVELLGDTELRVTGDLTIRGVTHEVTLDTEYLGAEKDPWGQTRIGFAAKTEIDREQFGVNWNQVLETGGVLVGKRAQIEIEAQAIPKAAAKPA